MNTSISRENSLVLTKLDEAIMWREKYVQLITPPQNESNKHEVFKTNLEVKFITVTDLQGNTYNIPEYNIESFIKDLGQIKNCKRVHFPDLFNNFKKKYRRYLDKKYEKK